MPFKRICPECGTKLVYAKLPGYQRALRTKALCRRCAASPAVVQKKMIEDADRMAATKSNVGFMSKFFEMVEANLSGSGYSKE